MITAAKCTSRCDVEPLQQVGAQDLAPVHRREGLVCHDSLLGLLDQRSSGEEFCGEHREQLIPLLLGGLGLGQHEHRAQGSGHYALAALGEPHQDVPDTVQAAELPVAALATVSYRLLEAGVGVWPVSVRLKSALHQVNVNRFS